MNASTHTPSPSRESAPRRQSGNRCRLRRVLVIGLIVCLALSGLISVRRTVPREAPVAPEPAQHRAPATAAPATRRLPASLPDGPPAGRVEAWERDATPPADPAIVHRQLQAVLNPSRRVLGTPVAGVDPIALRRHRIHPGRSSQSGHARHDGPIPVTTLYPTVTQTPSPRNRLPFIVRFSPPIHGDTRTILAATGVAVHDYLPHHAFLVEADADALARAAALPGVTWIGEYRPEYKFEPLLGALAEASPALPEPLRALTQAAIPVTIQTLTGNDAGWVAVHLQQRGFGEAETTANPRWGRLKIALPPAALAEVAGLAAVVWIEMALPRKTFNNLAVAADRMNVAPVWNTHGLTGAGQVVGHADTGLDTGDPDTIHPDFAGRIVFAVGLATGRLIGRQGRWDDPDGHGTHTAGSILGSGVASGGRYRGVAPDALLVHQSLIDRIGFLTGIPNDLNVLFQQAYTNEARIHSDSWGSAGAGTYTTDSLDCDQHTWDYPDMLLVFAAGNEGIDMNADGVIDPQSVGAPATAKNVLSVGASEIGRPPGSGGYSANTYGMLWPGDYPASPIHADFISSSPPGHPRGLAAFSSRGPTDDGRIKPDLVAPGTDIVSTRSQHPAAGVAWGASTNRYYTFMGGTSMSTPLVAGAAALTRQFFMERKGMTNPPPSAALLKATLIAGARSLTPGQYGTGTSREIPPLPHPNPAEGWGEVDLEGTLFPDAPNHLIAFDGPSLATDAFHDYGFTVDTGGVLRIAMVYSDHPAALAADVKLVNDLDLTLFDLQGNAWYPNGLDGPDRTNNVQTIDLSAPAAGVYRVRVSAHQTPFGPQPYALVLNGPVAQHAAGMLRFTDAAKTVAAGNSVTLEVERADGAEGEIQVDYATADVTAVAGLHYVATTGTLTFAQGETLASLVLQTLPELIPQSNRLFTVALSNPRNGSALDVPSVAWITITPPEPPTPRAVHRFWSPVYHTHFYTISKTEKQHVLNTWPDVWSYERIAFHAYAQPTAGTAPVHRFWSPAYRTHFYTISEAEKQHVLNTWPDVWNYERIAFHAHPTPEAGTAPVFRFWSPVYRTHFYTISEAEKQHVMDTWPDVWNYERVAFHAYAARPAPSAAGLVAQSFAQGHALRAPLPAIPTAPHETPATRSASAPSRQLEAAADAVTVETVAFPLIAGDQNVAAAVYDPLSNDWFPLTDTEPEAGRLVFPLMKPDRRYWLVVLHAIADSTQWTLAHGSWFGRLAEPIVPATAPHAPRPPLNLGRPVETIRLPAGIAPLTLRLYGREQDRPLETVTNLAPDALYDLTVPAWNRWFRVDIRHDPDPQPIRTFWIGHHQTH